MHSYFDTWRQRLGGKLGQLDAGFAKTLLSHIARDPNGVSQDTVHQVFATFIADESTQQTTLDYLLSVLQRDGYLIEEVARHRFRMGLLREYWRRRVR